MPGDLGGRSSCRQRPHLAGHVDECDQGGLRVRVPRLVIHGHEGGPVGELRALGGVSEHGMLGLLVSPLAGPLVRPPPWAHPSGRDPWDSPCGGPAPPGGGHRCTSRGSGRAWCRTWSQKSHLPGHSSGDRAALRISSVPWCTGCGWGGPPGVVGRAAGAGGTPGCSGPAELAAAADPLTPRPPIVPLVPVPSQDAALTRCGRHPQ